jgi:hypothetical protein
MKSDDEKQKIGKALKILKQYKRLTKKYQVELSSQRQKELDDMIEAGSIKFPAEYKYLTLRELEKLFRQL